MNQSINISVYNRGSGMAERGREMEIKRNGKRGIEEVT
jgi:hypothetical protein